MNQRRLVQLLSGMIVLVAGSAAAQEWRDALPGEALYEAKKRIERAELSAAGDPLEKASLHLQHADRRVNEMQEVAARGNTTSTANLADGYAEAMRRVENEIRRARNQGRDTSQALQEMGKATEKHSEVLTGLLDEVPEQAVPAIRHAREVSLRGRQTALEQLRGAGGRRGADRDRGRERRPSVKEMPRGRPGVNNRDRFPGSTGDGRGGGLPGSAGGDSGGPPGR